MPRGGRRPGAGRKPKSLRQHLLDGTSPNASVLGRVLAHPSSAPTTNDPVPIDEFDAPDTLTFEERTIWLKQAPHAFANRTLTRATSLAFERYCRVCVLEQNEAKSSGVGGANHRGLLKQLNAYELQFLLSPCGKAVHAPLPAAAVPVNPVAKFRPA